MKEKSKGPNFTIVKKEGGEKKIEVGYIFVTKAFMCLYCATKSCYTSIDYRIYISVLNSLQNNKFADQSNLKSLGDDKINVTEKL